MRVKVQKTLEGLLAQEDTTGNECITVEDTGPKSFELQGSAGETLRVQGTYALSNLLQELGWAQENRKLYLDVRGEELQERPSHRISRLIRDRYWQSLTRSMTRDSLINEMSDVKGDGIARLYLPPSDLEAQRYYGQCEGSQNFELHRLAQSITPDYALTLNSKPGLLGLAFRDGQPLAYVVPGGRFNEMYGWDSYFIILGLLQDGLGTLAQAMVEHMVYQIEHYGAVLNANRTYYITRSQPPFLASLIRLFLHADEDWLARCLRAADKEYREVWMGPDKLCSCGLSRYFDSGIGYPPETAIRHYGEILAPYAEALGVSVEKYRQLYLARRVAPRELDAYFKEDRAVRESGHDSSYRLEDRCTHLCTVDLNSLLYRYESDLAQILSLRFGGKLGGIPEASVWNQRAAERKRLMTELCWHNNQFFDYDWKRSARSDYISLSNFYPLWAGLADNEQAAKMVDALELLIAKGGLLSSSEQSRGPLSPTRTARQWDFPYGWAPHQMLIWEGLDRYGYGKQASELALLWLTMLSQTAVDYNGILVEKYDVFQASHKTQAEYENQGAQVRHYPKEGFAWTNASYQIGLTYLSESARKQMDRTVQKDQNHSDTP